MAVCGQWYSQAQGSSCAGGQTAALGTRDLQGAEDKVVFLESALTNISICQMGPDSSVFAPCAVTQASPVSATSSLDALPQTFYSHPNIY